MPAALAAGTETRSAWVQLSAVWGCQAQLGKTTLPTRPCAPCSLRLLTANRERQLWRGPRRDILKGLEIAGVSGHGGYSDHSLGGGGQSRKRLH